MVSKNISSALNTIKVRRSRSLLTMLGVVIAVASVTTVVSIGNGIKANVLEQANRYSQNVIAVQPAKITGSGLLSTLGSGAVAGVLTSKDATTIAKLGHVSDSVSFSVVGSSARGDASYASPVFAVSSDLPAVLNQQLAFGAFFTDQDDTNNVAVLGATAANRLFDQDVPLGRSFTIRGQQYIVDGVLSSFAATPFSNDTNFNDAIFVPSGSSQNLAPDGAPIYEILVKADNASAVNKVDRSVTAALTRLHGGSSDFSVLTPSERASQSAVGFSLLTDLVVAAGVIMLFVSGISIMNVMLVSVTERVHEIGIRKAIGATNRQILSQFLTEAATITVIGSLIGVLVALVASVVLHLLTSLTPAFDWLVAGESALAACLVGIIFGTVPALQAARKNPIAALRSE